MRRVVLNSGLALCVFTSASFAGTITAVDLGNTAGAVYSNSCHDTTGLAGSCTVSATGFTNTGSALFNSTIRGDENNQGSGTSNGTNFVPPASPAEPLTVLGNTVNFRFDKNPSSQNALYTAPSTAGVSSQLVIDLGTYNSNTGSGTAYTTGVTGVDEIWTMINANDSTTSGNIIVTLSGASSSGAVSETFTLTNEVDYRATTAALGFANSTFTGTPSTVRTTEVTSCVTGGISGASCTGDGVATQAIVLGNANNTTVPLANSTYWTDVQAFTLNANNPFLNGAYLDSITISSNNASGTSGYTQAMLFAALSYDQVSSSAPEPATMGIFGIGLAVLGGLGIRKSKKS